MKIGRKDDIENISDYDKLPAEEHAMPGFYGKDITGAEYSGIDDTDDDDDDDFDEDDGEDLSALLAKKRSDTLELEISKQLSDERQKKRRQAQLSEEEDSLISASGTPDYGYSEGETSADEAGRKRELSKTQEITRIIKLPVPKPVVEIIELLRAHTYSAFLVGECVSMMILGERVMDFDIACNASLDRIIAIFDEKFKTREDLLSRGELIIINGAMGISVAPYRSKIDKDGKPVYCETIDEDLLRRTFTSETVAYNIDIGIYDKFGGLACITEERTILKAIGEDEARQREEELAAAPKKKRRELPEKPVIQSLHDNPESVLTAMLKFARGEAEISPYTLKYINDNPQLLDMVLPSDVFAGFRKILLGRRITETLIYFSEVIFSLFPVLRAQDGFDQRSEYHEYTMYEHTAKAVGYAYPDYSVRLALLLHAAGKPDCAADRGEFLSYAGHAERAVMLSRDILSGLGLDERAQMRVLFLIRHHDDKITPDNVYEYSKHYGADMTRLLLLVQSANIRAKSSDQLNDRVSATLRQLADNVGNMTAPQRNRNTSTLDGLRNLAGMLGRKK